MSVGTSISAQQGMISISETERNQMGQGLGKRGGGGGKTVTFFFLQKRCNYCGCMSHVEDGYVLKQVAGRRF